MRKRLSFLLIVLMIVSFTANTVLAAENLVLSSEEKATIQQALESTRKELIKNISNNRMEISDADSIKKTIEDILEQSPIGKIDPKMLTLYTENNKVNQMSEKVYVNDNLIFTFFDDGRMFVDIINVEAQNNIVNGNMPQSTWETTDVISCIRVHFVWTTWMYDFILQGRFIYNPNENKVMPEYFIHTFSKSKHVIRAGNWDEGRKINSNGTSAEVWASGEFVYTYGGATYTQDHKLEIKCNGQGVYTKIIDGIEI